MENFERMIQQAELQVINLQLASNFNKNLNLLEKHLPRLHQLFKQYSPQESQLFYDHRGFLNLSYQGKPVFEQDPEVVSRAWIQRYQSAPLNVLLTLKQKESSDYQFIHDDYLAKLLSWADETLTADNKRRTFPRSINQFVQFGTGLGQELLRLTEVTNIHTLYLYEPDPDIFYAALHAIDWQPIFEHFSQQGRSINIQLGRQPNEFCEDFTLDMARRGFFNCVTSYFNKAYESPLLDQACHDWIETIRQYASGWGFFDDELMGLAHSIQNHRLGIPYLNHHHDHPEHIRSTPVFIIGNGPSLDKDLDFIANNQNKALVISCGTALRALNKNNIKPDIHIEIERNLVMKDWILQASKPGLLESTTLLALNTVHPDIFAMFGRKGIALKNNDVGALIIGRFMDNSSQQHGLKACNPTVGNGGVAFALALGLRNLHLFGMDCGYREHERHHSKHSAHYDKDTGMDKGLFGGRDLETFPVRGNFHGSVLTNSAFNSSRLSHEAALAAHSDVTCINCSDGAAIEGATPRHHKTLKLPVLESDKRVLLDEIFSRSFSTASTHHKNFENELTRRLREFDTLRIEISNILKEQPISVQEALNTLGEVQAYMRSLITSDKDYLFILVNGSLIGMCSTIARVIQCLENEQHALSEFSHGKAIVISFLEAANEKLLKNYETLDVVRTNAFKQ